MAEISQAIRVISLFDYWRTPALGWLILSFGKLETCAGETPGKQVSWPPHSIFFFPFLRKLLL